MIHPRPKHPHILLIVKGSEAERLFDGYMIRIREGLKEIERLAHRNGCFRTQYIRQGPKVAGLVLRPGRQIPTGWRKIKVKGVKDTVVLPKKRSCPKEYALITDTSTYHGDDLCKELFGKCPSRFYDDMTMSSGCGFQVFKNLGKKVIQFAEQSMFDELKNRPKGLRPIKESTLKRWEEEDLEQDQSGDKHE